MSFLAAVVPASSSMSAIVTYAPFSASAVAIPVGYVVSFMLLVERSQ